MKKCLTCNIKKDDKENFCDVCGSKLVEVEEEIVKDEHSEDYEDIRENNNVEDISQEKDSEMEENIILKKSSYMAPQDKQDTQEIALHIVKETDVEDKHEENDKKEVNNNVNDEISAALVLDTENRVEEKSTKKKNLKIIVPATVLCFIVLFIGGLFTYMNVYTYKIDFNYSEIIDVEKFFVDKIDESEGDMSIAVSDDEVNSILKDNLDKVKTYLPKNLVVNEMFFSAAEKRVYLNSKYGFTKLPISFKSNFSFDEEKLYLVPSEVKLGGSLPLINPIKNLILKDMDKIEIPLGKEKNFIKLEQLNFEKNKSMIKIAYNKEALKVLIEENRKLVNNEVMKYFSQEKDEKKYVYNVLSQDINSSVIDELIAKYEQKSSIINTFLMTMNKDKGKEFIDKYGKYLNINKSEEIYAEQQKYIEEKRNNNIKIEREKKIGEDKIELNSLVDNYLNNLVHAININKFEEVGDTLAPKSELYNQQLELLVRLNGQNIKEELMDYKVNKIEQIDDNTYKIHVYTKYKIFYYDESKIKILEFNEIYSAARIENKFKLTTLIENKLINEDTIYDSRQKIQWDYITSSSEVTDSVGTYYANNAVDGDINTTWAVRQKNKWQQPWIKLNSYNQEKVSEIVIDNGLKKSLDLYKANNRVKRARIQFSDGNYIIKDFPDDFNSKVTIKLPTPVYTKSITISIIYVYNGELYNDTCISEIGVY